MPSFCAVIKCSNNAAKTVGISYFRIPGELRSGSYRDRELQRQRREKWICALQRADLTETKLKYGRICSLHFHSG